MRKSNNSDREKRMTDSNKNTMLFDYRESIVE